MKDIYMNMDILMKSYRSLFLEYVEEEMQDLSIIFEWIDIKKLISKSQTPGINNIRIYP